MDHYKNARDGEWTYADMGTESNFMFRKGTSSDPVLHPRHGGRQPDEESQDSRKHNWAIGVSEWVIPVEPMVDLICDLLNQHERVVNGRD